MEVTAGGRRRLGGAAAHSALLALLALPLLGVQPGDSPGDLPSEVPEIPAEIREALTSELHITGLTFVGTRGDSSEFVLEAREAFFEPETNIARLEQVEINASDDKKERNFEVRCDRGELNIETNDFLAEGDVHGITGDGQHYTAPWVRYDHAKSLLYTDATVTMRDNTGTFQGEGFRYYVKERRFRLLGNVKVMQAP